jgi:hypothetical protein
VGGTVTPLQSRVTLAVDEWLGIFTCLYLYRQHDWVGLGVAATALVVMVYAIGYPMHWKLEREWTARTQRATPKQILAHIQEHAAALGPDDHQQHVDAFKRTVAP